MAVTLVADISGRFPPVEHASWLIWDASEALFSGAADLFTSAGDSEVDRVRVVLITPRDYEEMFQSQSPLDPGKLAALVGAALVQNAAAVVVDIETAGPDFQNIENQVATAIDSFCQLREKCSPTQMKARIKKRVFWAEGAVQLGNDPVFALGPALGQIPGPQEVRRSAPAVLQPDEDGRLRHVRECLQVRWANPSDNVPTQPALIPTTIGVAAKAIAMRAHVTDFHCRKGADELRPRMLPYLGTLQQESAESMINDTVSGEQPLAGKVAFLGGEYSAADRFYTADGKEHPGVVVLAAASIALANENLVDEPFPGSGVVLGIVLGLLTSYAHMNLRPRCAFCTVFVGFLLALLLLSLVSAVPFVLNLAGIWLGLTIGHMAEAAERGEEDLRRAESAEA